MSNEQIASLSPAELGAELRGMCGAHKVRMNHEKVTPELVVEAVARFRRTGRIHDAFDRESITAFGEIGPIRDKVEELLSAQRPVRHPAPVGPRPAVERPPHGPEGAPRRNLRAVLSEVIARSTVFDVPFFEGRPDVPFPLKNQHLPPFVKAEVVRVHDELASIDGAQEEFLRTYKFAAWEIAMWRNAREKDGANPLLVLPAELEEAVYERVSKTTVLDERLFENRRSIRGLHNDRLPPEVQREVVTIHADLAGIDGAQAAFRAIYKFTEAEIAAWESNGHAAE